MAENTTWASGRSRLVGIDLLRGLAIFLVLMNHVNMRLVLSKIPYARLLPAQWVSPLVWNGQQGVQIFFAVSGFLITSTSFSRWGSLSTISIREFYILRFARIAPLLLLLLAVLSALHAVGLEDFVVPTQTGGLGRALFAALTFHVNVLEACRGYLPANWDVLWSLSIEELFYLFFPLICRALGPGRRMVVLLLAFVVLGPVGRTALSGGNEVWQEYSYLGGMDAIALGCLTALALRRMPPSRVPSPWLGVVGSALLSFILCFKTGVESLGLVHSGLDMTVCAIGTCMVISAAARTRWQGPRIFAPLARIGRHSYEIYLTHMFVVFVLFDSFVAAGSPLPAVPALFIAVVLAAGLFAELVARFYSEPMNRFLRQRWALGVVGSGS